MIEPLPLSETRILSKDNVKCLKRLAVNFIGGQLTTYDIPGNTIAEVLAFMSENVTPQTALENKYLTVNCVAGSAQGTTVITVAGATNLDRVYLMGDVSASSAPPRGTYIPPDAIFNIPANIMPASATTTIYPMVKIPLGVNLPVGVDYDGTSGYMIELDEYNCVIAAGQFTYTVKLT